jgi:hypothetical protein
MTLNIKVMITAVSEFIKKIWTVLFWFRLELFVQMWDT